MYQTTCSFIRLKYLRKGNVNTIKPAKEEKQNEVPLLKY